MGVNLNRVVITGNLTRDPETRAVNANLTVTTLRVACNGRRKDQSGQWVDKPNYFDVTVFGAQGENCQRFLSRGRPVAIDGRLDWQEWDDKNGGGKRQAVKIIAESVQFLNSGDQQGGGGGGGYAPAPQTDVPADASQFAPRADVPVPESDDIPFKWETLPTFEELKGTWRA